MTGLRNSDPRALRKLEAFFRPTLQQVCPVPRFAACGRVSKQPGQEGPGWFTLEVLVFVL